MFTGTSPQFYVRLKRKQVCTQNVFLYNLYIIIACIAGGGGDKKTEVAGGETNGITLTLTM